MYYVFDIPWTPRSLRADWPIRAGKTFILQALSEALDAFNGLDWDDLVEDPVWTGGYRAMVTDKFEDALMTGSLVATSQPTTGGELRPIPPTDWTRQMVREMMETGTVERKRGRKRSDHWVFVDPTALRLMKEVLAVRDLLDGEDDDDAVDRLARRVLRNLSKIAGDDERAPEIVQALTIANLFLPSLMPEFKDADEKETFVKACVPWLEDELRRHPEVHHDKEFFRHRAERSFPARLMSGRRFDEVWAETVKSPVFKSRSDPGPKPKRR